MSGCRLSDRVVDAFLADPERPLDPHVQDCASCTAAVDGVRGFDRSLRLVAEGLVLEPLPPAIRLLRPGRARHNEPGVRRLGPVARLAPFASVIAVAVLAGALISLRSIGGQSGTSLLPGASRSAAASALQTQPATPSTACEAAFADWVRTWQEAGRPDHTLSVSFDQTERPAAIRAFSSCSLQNLSAANDALLATDAKGTPQPLIARLQKTVLLVCASDAGFAGSATCRDALSDRHVVGVYAVQPGDTLTLIAVRLGASVNDLLAVNPWISNPDLIYAGDLVLVPASATYPTAKPGLVRPIPSASP